MPRSELRSALPDGPILSTHQVSWLQDGPYTLPDGLIWSNICIKNKDELTEVYTLLTNNFVEDAFVPI